MINSMTALSHHINSEVDHPGQQEFIEAMLMAIRDLEDHTYSVVVESLQGVGDSSGHEVIVLIRVLSAGEGEMVCRARVLMIDDAVHVKVDKEHEHLRACFKKAVDAMADSDEVEAFMFEGTSLDQLNAVAGPEALDRVLAQLYENHEKKEEGES